MVILHKFTQSYIAVLSYQRVLWTFTFPLPRSMVPFKETVVLHPAGERLWRLQSSTCGSRLRHDVETRTGRGRGGRGLCFDDTFTTPSSPSSRQMLSSCQGEQRCWVKRNHSMQISCNSSCSHAGDCRCLLPPFSPKEGIPNRQLIFTAPLDPGEWLLDLGSSTRWKHSRPIAVWSLVWCEWVFDEWATAPSFSSKGLRMACQTAWRSSVSN